MFNFIEKLLAALAMPMLCLLHEIAFRATNIGDFREYNSYLIKNRPERRHTARLDKVHG